jgi:dethiobiotin synthase
MKGFFVTGTGTGVGKTVATTLLVHGLRAAGIDAVPAKPIQTGCVPGADGALLAPDLVEVLAATHLDPDPETRALMAPLCYTDACSPHLAAAREGRPVNTAAVVAALKELNTRHEWIVAEGAGGIMVPLDGDTLMIDLVAWLGLPVVVVAHAGLGTINHTLLTLGALSARGITAAGVILNEVDPVAPEDVYIIEDNMQSIARLGRVDVLGRIPHGWGPGCNLAARLECLGGWKSFLEKWT